VIVVVVLLGIGGRANRRIGVTVNTKK
jgi:hypothetical protein